MSLLPELRRYVNCTKKDWNYITPKHFYENYFKGKKNYILIDLRKPDAFHYFHVPRSVNIFWLDLLTERSLRRILKWKGEGKKIFLICYVGHTSSQAMVLLKLLGIEATSIKFGYGMSPVPGVPIAGWLQYHYPLTMR
jgi:rhodanese-related sulfurtransferase